MSEDKNLKDTEKDQKKDNFVEENNKEVETGEVKSDKKIDKKSASKNTKAIIIGVVACALCVTIGFASGKSVGRSLPATTKSYNKSKVVATVGDTKITGEDLKYRVEPWFYMNGKKKLSDDEIKAYESSMIDYMTTTEALYLAGKEDKIDVSDEDVESEYTSLMQSIAQAFSLDEEAFLKTFKISKDKIKNDLKKELIATQYMAKETDVTEKETENYYNKNKDEFLKVRASHILIKNQDDEGNTVSEEQKKKNKEKAEGILKRALAGEDFASLAKEYSEDTSAENGGDLDFFGKGQMVEPFEKSAFALKVGEVDAKLVESDFGYHIIKKTDEKYDDLDTIKEELQQKLSYEKQNNLIDNIMEKYNVDVKDEYSADANK